MSKSFFLLLVAFAALQPSSSFAQTAADAGQPVLLAKPLVEELRKGGYTLFLVHPELKPGRETAQAGEWWKDCFLTRGISEAGIDALRPIGVALKRLALPIQEVRGSEFCRSLNTGSALGVKDSPPIQFAALNTLAAQTSAGRKPAEAAEALRALLAMAPMPGKNLLLIGDAPDTAITPDPILSVLQPGEVAIFKVVPGSKPVFLTRISPRQWPTLVRDSEAKADAAVTPPGAPVSGLVASSTGPYVPPPKPLIDPAVEVKGVALLQALLKGGYVMHMRHGEATIGNDANFDVVPNWKDICELQRNLNPIGRENVRKVGEAMHKLHVPVGSVFTSQLCRARDSAKLMGYDNGAIELEEFNLASGQKLSPDAMERRVKRLSEIPAAGTNTLIVAHAINSTSEIERASAGSTFAEIMVYQPDSKGGTRAIGQLKVADWEALLKAAAGN